MGCLDPTLRQERIRASEAALLAELQDGKTTREAALLRYGSPTATFEGQRILTFDFVLDPAGTWLRAGPRPPGEWIYAAPALGSLVLVFDAQGLLRHHRLVTGLASTEARTTAPTAPKDE